MSSVLFSNGLSTLCPSPANTKVFLDVPVFDVDVTPASTASPVPAEPLASPQPAKVTSMSAETAAMDRKDFIFVFFLIITPIKIQNNFVLQITWTAIYFFTEVMANICNTEQSDNQE